MAGFADILPILYGVRKPIDSSDLIVDLVFDIETEAAVRLALGLRSLVTVPPKYRISNSTYLLTWRATYPSLIFIRHVTFTLIMYP